MTKIETKRSLQQSFMPKGRRIILAILAIMVVCSIFLVGVLVAWCGGKMVPFLDENGNIINGSISEKIYVNINGVQQGMIIKTKNINNPVLLFVHGGPGMPEYFLNQNYPTGLENYFTVCWWEQRGAGLSYKADLSAESITAEQLVSDTLAVTDYLRNRFRQKKIYLMGHSWGSYIGISAAAQAPEKYEAYIGIGQVSKQLESEKLAYEYMLEQYSSSGNIKMVQKLKQTPILESDVALQSYLSSSLRDEAMHDLGIGTMHNMKSVIRGIFLAVMQCREYTLSEKINLWRGKTFLVKSTKLRDQMYWADLTVEVPKLDISTYFFSGLYDYTVSYQLAHQYFEQIAAPTKGFYTFKESAHSPLFEEPNKFLRIMLEDVLKGKTGLADTD